MSKLRATLLITSCVLILETGFPGVAVGKNPPASAGDPTRIPGSGKCPGKGNGKLNISFKYVE